VESASGRAEVSLRPALPLPDDLPNAIQDPLNAAAVSRGVHCQGFDLPCEPAELLLQGLGKPYGPPVLLLDEFDAPCGPLLVLDGPALLFDLHCECLRIDMALDAVRQPLRQTPATGEDAEKEAQPDCRGRSQTRRKISFRLCYAARDERTRGADRQNFPEDVQSVGASICLPGVPLRHVRCAWPTIRRPPPLRTLPSRRCGLLEQ